MLLKIFNEFKKQEHQMVFFFKFKRFPYQSRRKMIERVLVNLITNSIFALENLQTQKENKH